MNHRMPKDRLTVGAYILQPNAQTERHIKELAECGVDMVVCLRPNDRSVLDLLQKYGVGAIVSGVLPSWWGGDGSNTGKMRELYPISQYMEAAKSFEDHPAVWGIDIADEPSALDFPYLNEIAQLVKTQFACGLPYLNLYPSYAAVSQNNATQTVNQLGTATYAEHIERYLEEVDLPYISYDFYLYPQTKNHNVAKMLENFRLVADACRSSGKAFWFIPQVNDRREESECAPSLNKLRYQAYHALCYGATVLTWGCYCAGWWNHNVLDQNGEKTEQYEKLKEMNRELHAIGDAYMQYQTVFTHLVGFDAEMLRDFPKLVNKDTLSVGFARDLRSDGAELVVGEMVHRTDADRHALLICNASDPEDEHGRITTVSLTSTRANVQAISGAEPIELHRDGERISFALPANRCVLLTFD